MRGTDAPLEAFFYLLRCGLWQQADGLPACFPLSLQQWRAVYELARQQTVRGLVFRGICLMPEAVMPPDGELVRWAACAEEIERKNRLMNRALADLCSRFCAKGLQPVVLKGQGVARCYAEPLLRECGDIDLYFPQPQEREQAEHLLQQAGVCLMQHADGSTSYRWMGVTVEHHPSAFDLQGRKVLARLQQLERKLGFCTIWLDSVQPSAEVTVPSPVLSLVLLNAHILKHTLGRGVGLRQLCDLARFMASVPAADGREEVLDVCRLAGITRWTGLLQALLAEHLGLPEQALLLPPERTDVASLLRRVLQGGNFGRHRWDTDAPQGGWRRKLQTAACLLQNAGFAWRYAPREAVCLFVQLVKGQKK